MVFIDPQSCSKLTIFGDYLAIPLIGVAHSDTGYSRKESEVRSQGLIDLHPEMGWVICVRDRHHPLSVPNTRAPFDLDIPKWDPSSE